MYLNVKIINYHLLVSISSVLFILFTGVDAFAETRSSLNSLSAGKIINITGDVEVLSIAQSSWQEAQNDQMLYPGDSIRTGSDGKASLIMSDETMIQLNRNTHFQLKEVERNAGWFNLDDIASGVESAAGSLYEIFGGKVWARNKNKKVSARFKTPTMTAGIRGTELTIEVDASGKTRTVVIEGSVEHINDFGRIVASEGESVTATVGSAPSKHVLLRPEEAVQWTLLIPDIFDEKAIVSEVLSVDAQSSINAAISAGRYVEASEIVSRSIAEANSEGLASQELQVLDAVLDIYLGSPVQAKKKLIAIQNAGFSNASLLRALAISALLTNDNALALTSARQATDIDPDDAASVLVMAYVYQSRYELEQAQSLLVQLVARDNDNVQALLLLAKLQFASGYNDEAWLTMRQAESVEPQNAYVSNLAGYILLAKRDHEKATDAFNRALANDAGMAEPHMGLGLLAMRKGDVDTALEEISIAVALEPQRAIFISYWGKMLYQIKRFDKALDMLAHAQKLDPNDPTPALYRSIIFRDLNRPGDAIDSLNEAIDKNDNRGLYRSRFLLDEDLATRNVDLSILYERLGLTRWAEAKAVSAIKQDYTNYSAHLFLAGILAEEEDRSYTQASESLLARLMQPANVNTFNSFNEYTSLLEQPDVGGQVIVGGGTQKTAVGEISAYGAIPDADLAWEIGVFGDTTDGWRETNFVDRSAALFVAKWQPTEASGILMSSSFSKANQGDKLYPRYEIDDPASPDDRLDLEFRNVELGYHFNASPSDDFLVYATWRENKQDSVALVDSYLALAPALYVDTTNTSVFKQPNTQLQFQYMKKIDSHQIITGVAGYRADVSLSIVEQVDFVLRDTVPPTVVPQFTTTLADNDVDITFISLYVQDNWNINRNWHIEAALYFDKMDNASAANDATWTIEEVNPRFGLIWTPNNRHTLRFAAFRYLLPFLSSRTDPTEVAGVSIFRNATEGTQTKEVDIVWEYEQSYGLYTFNIFSLESTNQIDEINILDGAKKGGEAGLDMLLSQSIGLFSNYRYEDVESELQPDVDRKDHFFTVGLKHLSANGFSAGVTQLYRKTNFANNRTDENISITDLEFGYEFPGKTGRIDLLVMNIFDEEFNWIVDNFAQVGRNPAREALLKATFNF